MDNKGQYSTLEAQKDSFLRILNDLTGVLVLQNLPQRRVTEDLAYLLTRNLFDEFVEKINSVDMWGGAGAVWEVDISDRESERQFFEVIIKLIDLMEQSQIIVSKGIKPVRKLFLGLKNKQ